jgi:hypothetical protein
MEQLKTLELRQKPAVKLTDKRKMTRFTQRMIDLLKRVDIPGTNGMMIKSSVKSLNNMLLTLSEEQATGLLDIVNMLNECLNADYATANDQDVKIMELIDAVKKWK